MSFLPLSRGLEFHEWANCLVEVYALEGLPITLPWKEWGERLREFPQFAQDVPSTDGFDDWHEWAERVVGHLY